MISGRKQRNDIRTNRKLESGKHFFGDRRAAEHVPALEHQHFFARAREIGGIHQTVVSAADDDDVVLISVQRSCFSPHFKELDAGGYSFRENDSSFYLEVSNLVFDFNRISD